MTSALTAQDVLGFEALAAWTASSGTASLTTTRTQGAAALALRAPSNYTPIVSAAIASSATGLAGLSSPGSVLSVDVLLPTQQPNPQYFGALQLFVSVPSRSVFNQFLGQIDLTGRPLGSYHTLAFAVPDTLRASLRGATFNDLTFTLALNAPSGATGSYLFDNLRVTGVVAVADFTIGATPSALEVRQGASITTAVSIAPTGGFAGTVALTTGPLPAGVTATFVPPTVTGAGSSTLTLSAALSAPVVAPTAITVTGTSGSLTHAISVTLAVLGDFTIAETPSSVTVTQGQSVTASVAIFPANGFTSTVTLSATGLPAGVTATFSPPALAGGGTSTLTLATSPATPIGPATITVIGTSGPTSHSATFVLTVQRVLVPDFAVAVAPTAVSVIQGMLVNASVSVSPIDGFGGVVTLTTGPLPAGVTASFFPPTIVGGGTSTLTLAASIGAALVTGVPVVVTAASGPLAHGGSLALTVVAAPVQDFQMAETPSTVTVFQGGSADVSVAVFPVNGFAGAVTLVASGLPGGVTATFSPAVLVGGGTSTLTLTASSAAELTAASTITVTGSSGANVHSITFVLSVIVASVP